MDALAVRYGITTFDYRGVGASSGADAESVQDIEWPCVTIGFADKNVMDKFFAGDAVKNLSERSSIFWSAVHACKIQQTLTYVIGGTELSHFQE